MDRIPDEILQRARNVLAEKIRAALRIAMARSGTTVEQLSERTGISVQKLRYLLTWAPSRRMGFDAFSDMAVAMGAEFEFQIAPLEVWMRDPETGEPMSQPAETAPAPEEAPR